MYFQSIIVNNNKGMKCLNMDIVDCDYFKFLDGDATAIRNFTFTYMSDYWWGENTLSYLAEMKYNR